MTLLAEPTYREGVVYRSRSSVPQAAVQRTGIQPAGDDERIVVKEKNPLRTRLKESRTEERRTARARLERTSRSEEETSVERPELLTSRRDDREARGAAARPTVQRRDTIDFVDDDQDGYDDRKNVNDL